MSTAKVLIKNKSKMSKEERIAKLNWVLSLIGELESEGVYLPETKAQVVNKINELSAC